MDADQVTQFLHRQIPLTAAMGLVVTQSTPGRLAIRAPLALNPNPHGTLFGGTLTALGLVSGWSMLHVSLAAADLRVTLWAQHSESDFLAPGTEDCIATATCPEEALAPFLAACRAGERARIRVESRLCCGTVEVSRHRGLFVALPAH